MEAEIVGGTGVFPMKDYHDAHGRAYYDFHLGKDGHEINERDDGLVGATGTCLSQRKR